MTALILVGFGIASAAVSASGIYILNHGEAWGKTANTSPERGSDWE